MTRLDKAEQAYADAINRILTDPGVRKDLESDPERTMERLGFDLDDNAREVLKARDDHPELGVAAVPAVLVRVATNGTRPAVRVAVSSSTFAATRGRAAELDKEK
jgi:hypothetical protein